MSEVTRYRLHELELDERDELLASRSSAMLAFVDDKGFPRLVPCWFLWDGIAFYVTSFTDKFHVRCLRHNPRASIGRFGFLILSFLLVLEEFWLILDNNYYRKD